MEGRESTLITRTQKQHVSHNVTTTTKTIREVQYIGPDGQPLDYIPGQDNGQYTFDNHNPGMNDYQNYGQMYPPPPGPHPPGQYNRPPTPPTPSERSHSPVPNHRIPDYLRQQQQQQAQQGAPGVPPRSGYEELDTTLMPPRPGADPYSRNSPSPGSGAGHQGYAGYPNMSPHQLVNPHSQLQALPQPPPQGRASVADSYHGGETCWGSLHIPDDPLLTLEKESCDCKDLLQAEEASKWCPTPRILI